MVIYAYFTGKVNFYGVRTTEVMMKTDKKCTPKSVAGILSAVVVAIGGCLTFCACGEKPNSGKPDIPPDPPKVAVNNDYMNPITRYTTGRKSRYTPPILMR